MITAKAAFWDECERLKFYEKHKTESIIQFKSISIDEENNGDIELLKELVNRAITFEIKAYGNNDNDSAYVSIEFTVPKTEEEIQKETEKRFSDCEHGIVYCKNRLRKWAASSDENKQQIEQLCRKFNITL